MEGMDRTNGLGSVFPTLETARLRLTALTPGDARDLFALLSDPDVTRYMGMAPLGDPAEAARTAARLRRAHRGGGRTALGNPLPRGEAVDRRLHPRRAV